MTFVILAGVAVLAACIVSVVGASFATTSLVRLVVQISGWALLGAAAYAGYKAWAVARPNQAGATVDAFKRQIDALNTRLETPYQGAQYPPQGAPGYPQQGVPVPPQGPPVPPQAPFPAPAPSVPPQAPPVPAPVPQVPPQAPQVRHEAAPEQPAPLLPDTSAPTAEDDGYDPFDADSVPVWDAGDKSV